MMCIIMKKNRNSATGASDFLFNDY